MTGPETNSHRRFFAWGQEYRFLYGPRAGENGEMECRLARVQLWDRLRPILQDMAKDLATAGMDPSDVFRLSGFIPAISTIPVEEVEKLLDNVWVLAKRLELIAHSTSAFPPAGKSLSSTPTVDELFALADPLKRGSESRRLIEEAFKRHCERTPGTHSEKAEAWIKKHKGDPRSLKQIKKASMNYPYDKPSKAK